MRRTPTLSVLTLAAALALTGCGDGQEAETPASGAAAETAAGISAEHNDADVVFAQMMIPHHEQAVRMSEVLLGKDGVPQDVRDLAERVARTQAPEIERLQAMLTAWDAPTAPDDAGTGHGGHGSGMVDEEGTGRLREAGEGPEAAVLYLEQMTQHHEGAVDMARDQVEQGANPEAVELAREVVEAQEAEIQEMAALLEEPRQS